MPWRGEKDVYPNLHSMSRSQCRARDFFYSPENNDGEGTLTDSTVSGGLPGSQVVCDG